MVDLTTSYLGLRLKNPLVASSSPLTQKVETAQALEAAGVSAIVLNSLFEEQIIRDILKREIYSDKTCRLLILLLHHGRMDILPLIVSGLPEAWRERQGIVSFEVRSAVPVGTGQKARLEEELRKLERRPVACRYILDPAVIGGLNVKKGNLVYDVSIKGQLERLKERIRER